MQEIENSDLVRYILQTLVNISSRKTTQGQAVTTMQDLIKNLQDKYDFLKNIEIKDTRFEEMDESISVLTKLNDINPKDLGKAIHDIIQNMNISLGKNAGYFFIRELKNNIDTNYSTMMENLGVDLNLMQLEFEVSELEKKITKNE